MKFNTIVALLHLMAIFCFTSSCSHIEEPEKEVVGIELPPGVPGQEEWRDSVYSDSQLRKLHRDTPLKILAIGNSFTGNATSYMPWLIDRLDDKAICIAKLTRPGCSLGMHWTSHVNDSPDYNLRYSYNGQWLEEDINTIDDALCVMEWDIITIQQESGDSGFYDTYQPYLNNLLSLFKVLYPDVKTAWHSTWPYRAGCTYNRFNKYSKDPEIMYKAILSAAAQASSSTDFCIPSTELIWRMREQYPEVEDGFSSDGFHISDPHALHALTLLWYETLISPYTGKSALDLNEFPGEVDGDFMQRALSIIADITKRLP